MEVADLKKIEKNKSFRKYFFGKLVWTRYALVPPGLVLFMSLFSVVYLFNIDMLISYFCIPFLLLLLLSTIWFKTTRKYLINKDVEKGNATTLCMTLPLFNHNGKMYYVFFNNENRFNKFLLDKTQKEIIKNKEDYYHIIENLKKGEFMPIMLENANITVNLKWSKSLLINKNSKSNDKFVVVYNKSKIRAITEHQLFNFS